MFNDSMESIGKNPKLVGLIIAWRAVTHQGLMRQQNEDAHLVAHRIEPTEDKTKIRYLFAIADGLGGHLGGAIASRMALESVKDKFHNHGGDAYNLVYQSLRHANQKIFMVAQSEPKLLRKMQTTMTAAVLDQDSLVVGHVGDCRLYRTRDGLLKLLTRDHTMANELLRFRLISKEQARQHQGRHQLTRSIGGEPFLDIDMLREKIIPGDTYLLCSDGLWSELSLEELNTAMQDDDIVAACEKLVGYALRSGGPDNITAVIFRVGIVSKNKTIFNFNNLIGNLGNLGNLQEYFINRMMMRNNARDL